MSFKRDGNDKNLLSVLQKRRISDLLAEDIPEEEAKLLSNGRFACLVCLHHPIFDTISMLSVHRDGKKHKSYAHIFERKKRELKQLILQRRQEQFIKNGTSAVSVASSAHSGLSISSPYDPRVHKHKVKRGNRKLTVDLYGDSSAIEISTSKNNSVSEGIEETTRSSASSSSQWQNIAGQQLNGPVKHSYKLKDIFKVKSDETVQISPYVSKSKTDQSRNVLKLSDGSGSATGYFINESYTSTSNRAIDVPFCKSQNCDSPRNTFPQTSIYSSPHRAPMSSTSSQDKQSLQASKTKSIKRKEKDQGIPSGVKRMQSETENKALAEKYYQLQGSGWKRDWDGKWIKDEQAEFDSDEEPPNIP